MDIVFEPRLVESTVFLAMRAGQNPELRAEWRRRLDAVYELAGSEEQRDHAFRGLATELFVRLDLYRPLRGCLFELPQLGGRLDEVRVREAPVARAVGSELLVRRGEHRVHRTALLRLLPQSLLTPSELLPLLRRELYHLADMVDPEFGYAPSLGATADHAGRENLARDRYRALWNVWIDCRLVRQGRLREGELHGHRRPLVVCFGEARAGEILAHLRQAARVTHADLVAIAQGQVPWTAARPRGAVGA